MYQALKYRLADYRKRIERRLPAVSMIEVDYIKGKYHSQLKEFFEYYNKVEQSPLSPEEHIAGLFTRLFNCPQLLAITDIHLLDRWLVQNLMDVLTWNRYGSSVGHNYILNAIIEERMNRELFFRLMSRKYFPVCVSKLSALKFSLARKIATNAFESAENLFSEYEDREIRFIRLFERIVNNYCKQGGRSTITLSS